MYRDAVREALDEEMARDDTVFNMGEDVGFLGGNFKCTEGLMDKYGDLRCKDTPISEQGFVGMGVGAALRGLRPVIELMFGDFMMVCMDQICNQMAKITYMSGGQVSVPMVIRMPIGGGRSSAAQHSQSFHAWVAHCPGMKVVVVEDLISTGGSSLKAVEAIRRDGCEVIGMVAAYTYGFPVAEEAFKNAKVTLVTLTNYEAVLDVALRTGYIEEEDIQTLNEWRKDPAHWDAGK